MRLNENSGRGVSENRTLAALLMKLFWVSVCFSEGNAVMESVTTVDPLALPRAIAKAIKKCTGEKQEEPPHDVKYLWVNVTEEAMRRTEKEHRLLSREEWLTLIDETAAIGVKYVILCLGKGVSHFSPLWEICQWAQSAHHTYIGLHFCEGALTDEARREIEKLDPKLLWLCVPESDTAGRAYAQAKGITLCSSEVTEEDHTPPCDWPEEIVFVGPDGILYTCGLVLGNDQFCLGKAMEKSLDEVFADDDLPHTIPPETDWARGRCNACPPIMVKRAFPDHVVD